MFQTKVDSEKNQLHVSFAGKVPAEEVLRCALEIESLLVALSPRFRLLTDLSALEFMEVASAPHVERMMDLCNQHKVDTVVRVVPDPHKDIGLNIMSLFHYRRGVRIVTCETLAEAERVLSS
jgi:anti-anti-sigma regulatory factor